jgi:hypothetical protein
MKSGGKVLIATYVQLIYGKSTSETEIDLRWIYSSSGWRCSQHAPPQNFRMAMLALSTMLPLSTALAPMRIHIRLGVPLT